MESITNLVPIRVDASSSDGAVRIIDTLLVDTTCLPVPHGHPRHDGVSGLNSFAGGTVEGTQSTLFSLSSLVNANASQLTESILSDAEVYGAVRSSTKTFMGGRLDLLSDAKLYQQIEKQIQRQLEIVLTTEKKDLVSKCCSSLRHAAEGTSSTQDIAMSSDGKAGQTLSGMTNNESRIVRIKIRLRHDNIVVIDEFDYDVNSSGMEGCDPFSIANSLVQDTKLPTELAPSIAASIVEQIYGVNVTDSLDGLPSIASARHAPSALVLDTAKDGTMADFAQIMLTK
ncbi:hypothetical protein ACHAXH_007133 [Discostella pseudostelligera]|jgi:hypothetical protein